VRSARRADGWPRNEVDIALLAQNRLFIIECKTRKMSGDDLAGPGAESLYKLDSLTSLLEFGALRKAARDSDPMFYQKLADARRHAA
jgi:hypothetical protein